MKDIYELAERFRDNFARNGCMFATAESCTGGLISASLTEVPGSSSWFERGFVTYTNKAKQELLGVSPDTLASFGAVSVETAREMARGALRHSHADIAVGVTGIAGPDGGTPDKPVGTVCIGFAMRNGFLGARVFSLKGQRHEIRAQSVIIALEGMLELADRKTLDDYT